MGRVRAGAPGAVTTSSDRVVLDTMVVSALLSESRRPEPAARYWELIGGRRLIISFSTVTEMRYGVLIEDMDLKCGDVIEGVSSADKGQEIFNKVLKVASGETTKSEELGYGDNEFVPWQVGAVM